MAKQFKNPFPNVGKWQNSLKVDFPTLGTGKTVLKVDFQSTGNGKTISKSISSQLEMAKQFQRVSQSSQGKYFANFADSLRLKNRNLKNDNLKCTRYEG
jgi:hypothetical protein